MLHFYADKGHRHYLPDEQYELIKNEIERMIEKGADYSFWHSRSGRSWLGVLPDYAGERPMEIAPSDWDGKVFLFGPDLLPDSEFRRVVSVPPSDELAQGLGRVPTSTAGNESKTPGSPETSLANNDVTDASDTTGESRSAPVGPEAPSISFGLDVITGEEVRWSLTIKGNPHLLIAGLPGMGKTTCLLNLCKQMVSAGVRPIIFSFHEDIDEKLQRMVDSVKFIDFDGLGFNPLRVVDRQVRLAHLDVAGSLRDIFTAIYPELGDIQGERLRRAIKESFSEKGWEDGSATSEDHEEPSFDRFLQILRSDPKPDRGLRTLLSRLDELDDYGFFRVNEAQSTLWDNKEPTVIRIHTTQNDNLQRAFAALVFYSLYKDMFRRGIKTI